MGMGIEKVEAHDRGFDVLTPGAHVSIGRAGQLAVSQRIGVNRPMLSCQLPPHLAPWEMTLQTPFRCIFQGNGLRMTIQGDSVIVFAPQQHIRLRFEGHFRPEYSQEVKGNRLLLDQLGGCGFFGIPARPTELQVSESQGWSLLAHLARWDELWVSSCPPRARNADRYFESIAHEGSAKEPYPSNEIIHGDAKYCKVFTVHEAWAADAPEWAENPPGATYEHPKPWETDHPVPANMDEFVRVRDEARRLGMKFVVYLSPFYSNAPDLFAEMERVLREYGVDGLYFDGWCGHREDFRPAYHMMRRARAILGDRLLYLHSSTEPHGTCRVHLPFAYAYADYVLSGEAGRDGLELDEFLRYTVSAHQISNSVGAWCYYGSMGLPGYHNIVPSSEHIDKALQHHARIWRTAQAWSSMPEELERFDRHYYQRLAELRTSSRLGF